MCLAPQLLRPGHCAVVVPSCFPKWGAVAADPEVQPLVTAPLACCRLWLRMTLFLCPAEAQVAPDVCFKHNSEHHLHLHCLTEYGKRPCSPK